MCSGGRIVKYYLKAVLGDTRHNSELSATRREARQVRRH